MTIIRFLAALLLAGCTVPDLTDVDTWSCPWGEENTHAPEAGTCLRADAQSDSTRVRTLDTFDNYPEDGRDETVEPGCGSWSACATANPMWGEVIVTSTSVTPNSPGEWRSTWLCSELPPCSVAFDPAWRER